MKSAQAEFAATVAEIRALADQLQLLVDDHLGIDPSDINWLHVGDAKRLNDSLRDAIAQLMPLESA